MAEALTNCKNIFDVLETSGRYWGKRYRDFFNSFYQLDRQQILELKKSANIVGVHQLMYQYTGHIIRNYSQLEVTYLPQIFRNVYWLTWLEDGRHADYRDTILNVIKPFMEVSSPQEKVRSEIFIEMPFKYESENIAKALLMA